MRVCSERHALERLFRLFSYYQRELDYDKNTNTYTLKVYYYDFDQNALMHNLLSAGHLITVIEPEEPRQEMIRKIRDSLDRYKYLLRCAVCLQHLYRIDLRERKAGTESPGIIRYVHGEVQGSGKAQTVRGEDGMGDLRGRYRPGDDFLCDIQEKQSGRILVRVGIYDFFDLLGRG